MDIQSWLDGNQNYDEGLALFKKSRPHNPVISILESGNTYYNRGRLLKELTLLSKKSSKQEQPLSELTAKAETHSQPAPVLLPPRQRTRGVKENYPPELIPAFNRQVDLYNHINFLHPQWVSAYRKDKAEGFKISKQVKKIWQEIDDIYILLDYWTAHKVVLPNKYNAKKGEELEIMDREDMLKRRNNLRTYVSRDKDNTKKKVKVDEWIAELKLIDKRLAV